MASAFQNLWNKWTGKHMTEAQQEVNAFNAAEAQKARDFEQQMSNTAYQRQAADMIAAGVNPALAMGATSNGASTPGGSAASAGADPSAGGLPMSDLMSLLMSPLGVIQGIEAIKGAQKDNELKDKQIAWYDREHSASTEGVLLDNAIKAIEKEYKGQYNEQQLKNMAQEYENLVAEGEKKVAETNQITAATEAQTILNAYLDERQREELRKIRAEISKMNADRKYVEAQKTYQDWYNNFVETNDFLPSTNDALQIATFIGNLFGVSPDDVKTWFQNAIEKAKNHAKETGEKPGHQAGERASGRGGKTSGPRGSAEPGSTGTR